MNNYTGKVKLSINGVTSVQTVAVVDYNLKEARKRVNGVAKMQWPEAKTKVLEVSRNKTYKVMGRYTGDAPEEVDNFDTYKEAKNMLKEYRMAYGSEWSLWIQKSFC